MTGVLDRWTQDIAQQPVRLVDDLVFWPHHGPTGVCYRIEAPSQNKFFTVGYEEYVFISLLDGRTTPAAACGRAAGALGREALSQDQGISLVHWLLQNRLATLRSSAAGAPQDARSGATSGGGTVLQRLNPFWMKIPLVKSTELLEAPAKLLSPLFSVPAVLASVLLMLIALVVIATQWAQFSASSAQVFEPMHWVWALVIWVGLKLFHEWGHAAACQRFGGRTSQLGLVLILFAPMPYVDVTSSWRIKSRLRRIAVSAAGMYVEMTIAAAAAILWAICDAPVLQSVLFDLIFVATLSTVLFNANPLMRFDGYYILTDLADIPNLAGESSKALIQATSRFFFARRRGRIEMVGWRRPFIYGYGVAAVIWKMFLGVTIGVACVYMFHGAGIVLLGFVLSMWIVKPALRAAEAVYRAWQTDPPAGLRAVLLGGALGIVIIGGVFWVPVPSTVASPAIVDYVEGSRVRSRASGFIDHVFVKNGQSVKAGDQLLRLRNDELDASLADLDLQIQQSVIRQRVAAQRRDMATVQMEQRAEAALADQFRQLQEQIEHLVITAHRDGQVVARGLEERIGQYVEEGDVVGAVHQEDAKRLVVSIAQQDLATVSRRVGDSVAIKTMNRTVVEGTLEQVRPLASKELLAEALAGVNGGPLAVVQTDGEKGYELMEPRFQAIIELESDHSQQLAIGQRAQAHLGARRHTVYWWLRLKVEKMLSDARQS